MKIKNIILVAITGLTLYSCGTGKLEKVDEIIAKYPNEDVRMGVELYAMHCGRCHKLFEVKSISKDKWDKVLSPMIKKAKLTEEQGKQVTEFVYWELAR